MRSWRRSPILPAVLLSIQVFCARADSDAVIFPASSNAHGVGYLNGGVGWSFVATTNLVVTWIGYRNTYTPTGGITGVRITFWASTNAPLASYLSDNLAGLGERDTNDIVYGRVSPLLLEAGREYFVTSDLGTNAQALEIYSSDLSQTEDRPFQAASDLLYRGVCEYDAGSGFLKPDRFSASGLLLGPTFRYQSAATAIPRLMIELVGGAVLLAWPTNTPECVVEVSSLIASTTWEQATNAPPPTISGDRYLYTYRLPDNQPRFFRLRLR